MTSISFGKSFNALDNNDQAVPFAVALDEATEISTARLNNPFWKIQERLTGTGKKIMDHRAMIRAYCLQILSERKKEGFKSEKKDFLQLFMDAKDDMGNSLSDDAVIDTMITTIIAARDTTANTLTWMMYSLYKEGADETMAKTLVKEIDDILVGEDPTYNSHKQQKYTEACFNECKIDLCLYESLVNKDNHH